MKRLTFKMARKIAKEIKIGNIKPDGRSRYSTYTVNVCGVDLWMSDGVFFIDIYSSELGRNLGLIPWHLKFYLWWHGACSCAEAHFSIHAANQNLADASEKLRRLNEWRDK